MKRILLRVTGLMMVAALALGGCTTAKVAPAPGEAAVLPNPAATGEAKRAATLAALYFNDDVGQHVVPEGRDLGTLPEDAGARATALVRELLKGPSDPYLLRAIPQGSTLVEPVTIAGDTARVNLSKEFATAQGSAAIDSLVYTLTDAVATVAKVQILVDGKAAGEATGRRLNLYAPFFGVQRITYLQQRVKSGLEGWRVNLLETVSWEGRRFGFTEQELSTAALDVKDREATATVRRGADSFKLRLARNVSPGMDNDPKQEMWLLMWIERDLPIVERQYDPKTKLTPVVQPDFTISLPEGWQLDETRSAVKGDNVVFADPSDPRVLVVVTKQTGDVARVDFLADDWRFRGRNPEWLTSASGLTGRLAEGNMDYEPGRKLVAAGYVKEKAFLLFADGAADTGRFESVKPVLERIVRSFQPK